MSKYYQSDDLQKLFQKASPEDQQIIIRDRVAAILSYADLINIPDQRHDVLDKLGTAVAQRTRLARYAALRLVFDVVVHYYAEQWRAERADVSAADAGGREGER